MQDIIYDIHSKSPLIIGYAGETNARNAVFKGYNKVKDNSSIVINIKGIGSRPLVNFCLPVKYTYTKDEGTYEAYLCELITENGVITYERHSNNFEMLVKHSAPLETEATPSEEQFDDWSAEITGAIADLNGRAASGEFDGEDGFSPTVNITKTGRTTTITITDKSGTHTATVTDGADGGAYDDTSIKNRLNAIEGKEEEWNAKAETTDIPTKVSELQNDKGYLTEHQDISGLVEKVDGKGLSTNDYDNNAKNKVDAIPANAKYTDTVYDDTAVKGRLNAIEDMADGSVTKQLNDDLANYGERLDDAESDITELQNDKAEVFMAKYGTTTYAEIKEAYNDGKICYCLYNGYIFLQLVSVGNDRIYFGAIQAAYANFRYVTNGNEWNGNTFDITSLVKSSDIPTKVRDALASETDPAWTSEQQTKALARLNAVGTNVVSDAYDSTKQYYIGDYCIYQNKLYKALTDCQGVVPTNETSWESVQLIDAINPQAELQYKYTCDGTEYVINFSVENGRLKYPCKKVIIMFQCKDGNTYLSTGNIFVLIPPNEATGFSYNPTIGHFENVVKHHTVCVDASHGVVYSTGLKSNGDQDNKSEVTYLRKSMSYIAIATRNTSILMNKGTTISIYGIRA